MKIYPKHGFRKDVLYACATKYQDKEIMGILSLCLLHGLAIAASVIEKPIDKDFPYLLIETREGSVTLTQCKVPTAECTMLSRGTFLKYLKGEKRAPEPFNKSLVLNATYTAIVTKEDVLVGCTHFSHKVIRELANLSARAEGAEL
jgi:hypothetical protein